MTAEILAGRIKRALEGAFGVRLSGVVVYGSEARGESGPDSDVDVLVLLEGPVSLWEDSRSSALALQDLESELGRPIHAVPVDVEQYAAQEFSLYRGAHVEGIRA